MRADEALRTAGLDFERIRTPARHGDVLVEPSPAEMRRRLDHFVGDSRPFNTAFLGADLHRARRFVRGCVVGSKADLPLVVTGHQPEFIHPGVWAKHVVASRLAEAAGGVGLNVVVDSDTPGTGMLRVPSQRDGRLVAADVRLFSPGQAATYADVPAVERGEFNQFATQVRTTIEPQLQGTLFDIYFRGAAAKDMAADFVEQHIAGRRAVEMLFGAELIECRISQCCFAPLLAEMVANAPRFSTAYNEALAQYRRDQNIPGTKHPIPDLQVGRGRFELPVWAVQGGRLRRRLFVEPLLESFQLYADEDRIGVVRADALLDAEQVGMALGDCSAARFHPRALALTLWARLLLADLFIHGIGGAKYDRINDLVIEKYFGLAPPPMACVSATWLLDLPRHDASEEQRRVLVRQIRDMQCNPQRHLNGSAIQELVEARRRAVDRSEALARRDPKNHAERRAVFRDIRSINNALLQMCPEVLPRLRSRLQEIGEHIEENAVANSREYFFGLFSRGEMQALCDALPAVSEFGV
jgi:hypothetical protein